MFDIKLPTNSLSKVVTLIYFHPRKKKALKKTGFYNESRKNHEVINDFMFFRKDHEKNFCVFL